MKKIIFILLFILVTMSAFSFSGEWKLFFLTVDDQGNNEEFYYSNIIFYDDDTCLLINHERKETTEAVSCKVDGDIFYLVDSVFIISKKTDTIYYLIPTFEAEGFKCFIMEKE